MIFINTSFLFQNTFNGSDDSIDYKSDLRIHAQHHGHAGHEGHAMADNGGGHDMAMTVITITSLLILLLIVANYQGLR